MFFCWFSFCTPERLASGNAFLLYVEESIAGSDCCASVGGKFGFEKVLE